MKHQITENNGDRRIFHCRVQTNKEGLIDQISPIYGLKSIADKSDMDFMVDLVPYDQPISEASVEYSTDHYSDNKIPSIMETAFDEEKQRKIQKIIDNDMELSKAEEQVKKLEAILADESPEEDFWDEPDFDDGANVLPFENTQTADDKMLTAKQVALELFNNDCEAARAILYTKEMRRKLGAYSRGKGCKVFYPESKVLAYKAKQPICSKVSQCTFQNMLWTDPQTKGPMHKHRAIVCGT